MSIGFLLLYQNSKDLVIYKKIDTSIKTEREKETDVPTGVVCPGQRGENMAVRLYYGE